ncbi:hypothetical protein [Levilactobacillus brevis]|uniref:hypothetical protein n=1 Tax=Levilactobacillus brevis TaxID=1580 RepID=UPI001119567A|nr:hypothetical protein [Levilactobacillus brevis]QCZ46818.1 Hypothetical protein UCCLB556_1943 [Levilactobacillus brevis]
MPYDKSKRINFKYGKKLNIKILKAESGFKGVNGLAATDLTVEMHDANGGVKTDVVTIFENYNSGTPWETLWGTLRETVGEDAETEAELVGLECIADGWLSDNKMYTRLDNFMPVIKAPAEPEVFDHD